MEFISALSQYPWLYTGIALILGLLVGSFFNVVIYRLPRMMQQQWQSECRLLLEIDPEEAQPQKTFNLAYPNSHCPECNSPIKPHQNIPVLSYLLLKGKCANCQSNIPVRYPIIEAITGILTALIVWQFGLTVFSALAIIMVWALLILTVIDIDHQLLPDLITLPLLWLGLIINSFNIIVPINDALWGAVIGYLSLWSVYWAFKLLTGKEGMGYGDFKLLAALGAWLGWQQLPLIILLSSLVGAIIGIALLTLQSRGRNTPIPFGPYLAIAGAIAVFWGDSIVSAYLGQF